MNKANNSSIVCFSALQRAEIAEIRRSTNGNELTRAVSVLFNEPKLLKYGRPARHIGHILHRFSALQRAEIAEITIRLR